MSVLLIFLLALRSVSWGTLCDDYTSSDLCTNEGCDWVETTKTACLAPTVADCSSTTPEACETVKGCEWNAIRLGYCGAGCQQNSANGSCAYPDLPSDCENLSGRDSCESAESEGCKWGVVGGYCDYQGPDCDDLDQEACSNTSGCSYESIEGSCNKPNSDACDSFSTSDACESSNSGCKWFASIGSCNYPHCNNIETESVCGATPGCSYRPKEKNRSDCETEGSGCKWYPDSFECSRPSDEECSSLSKADCSSPASGCEWNVYKVAGCGHNNQCSSLSETACKDANSGCTFHPIEHICEVPDNSTCVCLSQDECGAAGSGCEWNYGGQCLGDNGEYCQTVQDGSACDIASDEGCYWVQQGRSWCRPNHSLSCQSIGGEIPTGCSDESIAVGCEWKTTNSIPYCGPNYNLYCEGESYPCSSRCRWFEEDGYCQSKYSLICIGNNNSNSCSAESQEVGCKWTETHEHCGVDNEADVTCNLSHCTENNDLNCFMEDCMPNACSPFSSEGCLWEEVTPAHCGVSDELNCELDKDNCISSQYCQWRDGSSYCNNTNGNVVCVDNAEKNECDVVNSDSLCKWIPDEACYLDDIQCDDNDQGTECSSGSSPACKWIESPAECGVNSSLYCINNSTNTGCDTNISDEGCVWYEPTNSSCNPVNLECTTEEDTNNCSESSLSKGCKTRTGIEGLCKEKGSSDNNNSSVVFVPVLAIVLLVTLLL